jgi:hypothetical protein
VDGAVDLFLFQPLLAGNRAVPVPVLVTVVVLVDVAVIKMLVAFNPFQGECHRGVGWFRSLVTSGIGNALSYFVGYIATSRPWEMQMVS